MCRALLLIAAMAVLPRVALGQEPPPQPLQELFFTEVVYPQEKGEVQFTLGARVDRSRAQPATLLPIAIEYGLTDRWQIEMGWDGYAQSSEWPFKHLRTARLSIGTKYSVMNIGHSHVHGAFGLDVEFPRPGAFAEGEGEDGTEIEPFVAFAADVRGGVSVFGSVGASLEPREVADLATRGARPEDRGTIGCGALVAFRHVTLAAEYTSRSDGLPWRLDGAALVTPSIVVHPGHQWELAVGVPIAAARGERQPGVAVNIVKEH
jgi:hypothetical protein